MSKKTQSDNLDSILDDIIYLPDHTAKIAELAYFKAENRGFEPGQELDDWLEAEQEFSY
ncbi:MAG: DUF2934 domain-containing protein [Methylococcaceae bacterium]|nr:DUF2934 domain-containing protein [Methylococcaceae bacterium]